MAITHILYWTAFEPDHGHIPHVQLVKENGAHVTHSYFGDDDPESALRLARRKARQYATYNGVKACRKENA
jgi:hypothetical protein